LPASQPLLVQLEHRVRVDFEALDDLVQRHRRSEQGEGAGSQGAGVARAFGP
jgi:hypothetical protein